VTIAELPDAPEAAYLGFHVREIPLGEGKGAIVEVDRVKEGSPAFRAGLRVGMKIVGVGRIPTRAMTAFETAIRAFDPELGLPLFILAPDGRPVFLPIGRRSPAAVAGPEAGKKPREGRDEPHAK
jgi:S1-C subfamily serine protease